MDPCLSVISAILAKLKTLKSFPADQAKILTSKFRQLGLFSKDEIIPRGSTMRTLGALLEEKCQFQDGEVDIVLLQHTFEVERAEGKMETITSTLEAYGDRNGGPSAMVRSVPPSFSLADGLVAGQAGRCPMRHGSPVHPRGCAYEAGSPRSVRRGGEYR
jgi:hypothetical protein